MAPKSFGLMLTVKIMYFQFFSFPQCFFLPLTKAQTFKQKKDFVIDSMLVKMHEIRYNFNLINQATKFGKNSAKYSEQSSKENWLFFDLNVFWFT